MKDFKNIINNMCEVPEQTSYKSDMYKLDPEYFGTPNYRDEYDTRLICIPGAYFTNNSTLGNIDLILYIKSYNLYLEMILNKFYSHLCVKSINNIDFSNVIGITEISLSARENKEFGCNMYTVKCIQYNRFTQIKECVYKLLPQFVLAKNIIEFSTRVQEMLVTYSVS